MATKLLNYEMHGVCETSNITSTVCGHLYSLQALEDTDNGSVCALGDYVKGEVWKAAVPAKTDKVILIATSIVIYEDYTKKCQEEARFYNAKGDIMRGYELKDTDKFALSAEAFADDADPAVGKYVVVDGTGYKLTTVEVEPKASEYGFIGFIYDTATNGNYRVIVKKNAPVIAAGA